MKKIIASLFLACISFLFSIPCFAWNATGHILIAKIAYKKLKPNVRSTVDYLTAMLGNEYPEIKTFPQIAPWPDSLRGQKITTYTRWHYVDIAFSDDNTLLKNVIDTDNALWAIEQIKPVVQNHNANSYERARFLAFLVHIVGDLHQPLHTVSRFSVQHAEGDQGGNLFIVMKTATQLSNLHALWDGGVGLFAGSPTDDGSINALADSITAQYPESYFGEQATDLKQIDWVDEGEQLAKTVVYHTPEKQLPGPEYFSIGQEVARKRVALAGYRLAHLLNTLLG